MLLIDSKHSGNLLLIDSKHNGNVLFIDKKLAELEDDAKCVSLSKLIELVEKPSSLARIWKKKPHCLISHSLARFVELVGWLLFRFAEGLAGLFDNLAISRAVSREEKVAIGFSG